MTKEANPYDAVNLEADQVVDRYISPEIVRHVNCGCHQCMMQAQALCNNWLAGVDASPSPSSYMNGWAPKFILSTTLPNIRALRLVTRISSWVATPVA